MAVIWKGSTELKQSPDSPEIVEDANESSMTFTFVGPYATCLSSRPKVGSLLADSNNLAVSKVSVSKLPGGRGRLVIVCSRSVALATGASLSDDILEVDQVRIEKPLGQHPRFASLSSQDFANAKKWAEDPSKYTGPSFGTGPLAEYATRLARGQDTYVIYAPVIKLTTEHLGTPTTGGCGKPATPPAASSVSGSWVWMKTADNARRTGGRTSRNQEWTGADAIDDYIYGTGSGLP